MIDYDVEKRIKELLVEMGITVAVAESTGSMISHRLTGVSGSSTYFIGGILAYSNNVKKEYLKVQNDLLVTYGSVSEQTALAMTRGIRQLLNSDIGIAETSIAGPTGGSLEKPVGLSYVAVSGKDGELCSKNIFAYDREKNRIAIAQSALELLEKYLHQYNR